MHFNHVNCCYQLMKGYLGCELQDMEKVVVYTTGRYLTEFAAKTGFNAAINVKGKFISGSLNDSSKPAEPSIIETGWTITVDLKLSGTAIQENMILFIIISALTSEEFRLRQAYRKHNSYVQSRVPAEDLLVWKVKDGWEPLCKFLNCPIPEGPIPHDNRTGDTKFIEGLVRVHNLSKLMIHASHLFVAYPYNQLKNMHGNLNL